MANLSIKGGYTKGSYGKGRNALDKMQKRGAGAILAAGAAIQLLTGFPSAWGAFRQPVMDEFRMDGTAAAFAANAIVAAYGLGCVLGGYLQDKKGPKAAGVCGTLLLCGGLLLAGFLPTESPGLFYLAFSLPVGLGCAFLYPPVLGCVQKWYAQRKGFATGIVSCGVGLSGLVLTLLVRFTTRRWGIRACFFILAALLLPLCGGGSLLLRDPQKEKSQAEAEGLRPKQILRTRAFWFSFFALALAAPAVLLFGPSIPQIAAERGLDEKIAVWLAALGAAGGAAGRLLMPMLGEKTGLSKTAKRLLLALTGLSIAFAFGSGWWVAAVYLALCFCYGGEIAIMPALCTQLFGLAHTGLNYGFLALGTSLGSLAFPLLAQMLGLSGGRHFLAAGAALGGVLCMAALQKTPQCKDNK